MGGGPEGVVGLIAASSGAHPKAEWVRGERP